MFRRCCVCVLIIKFTGRLRIAIGALCSVFRSRFGTVLFFTLWQSEITTVAVGKNRLSIAVLAWAVTPGPFVHSSSLSFAYRTLPCTTATRTYCSLSAQCKNLFTLSSFTLLISACLESCQSDYWSTHMASILSRKLLTAPLCTLHTSRRFQPKCWEIASKIYQSHLRSFSCPWSMRSMTWVLSSTKTWWKWQKWVFCSLWRKSFT